MRILIPSLIPTLIILASSVAAEGPGKHIKINKAGAIARRIENCENRRTGLTDDGLSQSHNLLPRSIDGTTEPRRYDDNHSLEGGVSIQKLYRRGNGKKSESPKPVRFEHKVTTGLVQGPSTRPSGIFTPLTNSIKVLKNVARPGEGSSSNEENPTTRQFPSFMRPLSAGVQKLNQYSSKIKKTLKPQTDARVSLGGAMLIIDDSNQLALAHRGRIRSSGSLNELGTIGSSRRQRELNNRLRSSTKSRHAFDGGYKRYGPSRSSSEQRREASGTASRGSSSNTGKASKPSVGPSVNVSFGKPPTTAKSHAQPPPESSNPEKSTRKDPSGMSNQLEGPDQSESSNRSKITDPLKVTPTLSSGSEQSRSAKQPRQSDDPGMPTRKARISASETRLNNWLDQSVHVSQRNLPSQNHPKPPKPPGLPKAKPATPGSSNPQPFLGIPTTKDVVPIPGDLAKVKTKGDWTNRYYEKLEAASWDGIEFEGPIFSGDFHGQTPSKYSTKPVVVHEPPPRT